MNARTIRTGLLIVTVTVAVLAGAAGVAFMVLLAVLQFMARHL